MMLEVQRMQAPMAKGDAAAYGEQRAHMKTIGAALAAAGPEAFKTHSDTTVVAC